MESNTTAFFLSTDKLSAQLQQDTLQTHAVIFTSKRSGIFSKPGKHGVWRRKASLKNRDNTEVVTYMDANIHTWLLSEMNEKRVCV